MKSQIAKIGGAVTLGLFLMGMGSKAGAAPSTPADHLAVAAQCEKKATDVQASIDQVLKAKADNMSQWKLRKASPPSRKITLADEKYNETLASLTAEIIPIVDVSILSMFCSSTCWRRRRLAVRRL